MSKEADTQPALRVKIIAPTETFYDGPAVSVSAANSVGAFDILANHANFFSLLTQGDVAVNTGRQVLNFPIFHGIIKVTNNVVTLFVYLPDETT